jgi:hypothetical protein
MRVASLIFLTSLTLSSIQADEMEDPSMNPSNMPTPTSCVPVMCPPKNPCEENSDRIFEFFGEYLLLQVKEEGLEYAFNSSLPAEPAATLGVIGSVKRIPPEYHSGYRIGATYFLPHKKAELTTKWMHIFGGNGSSTTAPAGGVIWPDWLNENFAPVATAAKARWHMDLNVYDLQVGTQFEVKNILSLKPFAGFRAAWVKQQVSITYSNVTESTVGTLISTSINSMNKSHSKGFGVCAGLDTKWKIWGGLSLFADGAASLLWSHFKNSQIETLATGGLRSSVSDNLIDTVPVLEITAGLAWDYNWEKVGLGLRFGWEGEVWFNQNQLDRYTSSFVHGGTRSNSSNVNFTGYNFRASVNF